MSEARDNRQAITLWDNDWWWWRHCEAKRVLCVLDNLNHALPERARIGLICKWHDRSLIKAYERMGDE